MNRQGREAGHAVVDAAARVSRAAAPVQRAVACAALTLLLSACGGGGGGGGTNTGSEAAPVQPVAPVQPNPPVVVNPPVVIPPVAVGPAPAGYRLVWADEFDVAGLPDATRWAFDTERNRAGWYNNELQYYAALRPENSVVADGRLRIAARQELLSSAADWGGQRYTSARLITRGKAAWTYGFFEIRAKLPCGRGTWPAIWMLGTGGVWPDDGEIDIMEQVGSNPSRVFGTVHTLGGSGGASQGAATQVPDACTAFHNYQLHWTADEMAIGVDGVVYFRYANPRTGRRFWPFEAPQYLILNIAIGGVLGGPVDNSIFPVTMEVEHVRVWQ